MNEGKGGGNTMQYIKLPRLISDGMIVQKDKKFISGEKVFREALSPVFWNEPVNAGKKRLEQMQKENLICIFLRPHRGKQ